MSRKQLSIFIISILFAASTPMLMARKAAETVDIRIDITGLRNSKGSILVGIWKDKADFPDQAKAYKKDKASINGNRSNLIFRGIPPGSYAIAVIHDENDNRKQDKSLFGFPEEGFGFSNNPKIKNGPATFEESRFVVASEDMTIPVHVIYL